MKAIACLFLASVLVKLTFTFTIATVSKGLVTAAHFNLERAFGRQVIPSLTPVPLNQLQTSFEEMLRLLRAKNAILFIQDCQEGKRRAVTNAVTTLNDGCD